MNMTEESQRLKEEENRERRKAEYDRWFARGTKASESEYLSMCRSMRPDSNAFLAFESGYISVWSKK